MGKIAKLGSFVVAISLFVLGATLPNTNWIDQNRAVWITIVAIISLGVGVMLYWLGIGLEKRNIPKSTTKNIILSDSDKAKVSALMETVNAISDNLDRYMEKSLYGGGDRVVHYQNLIDGEEFQALWDKCSSQRAQVSVISPRLSDLVWKLLNLHRVITDIFCENGG